MKKIKLESFLETLINEGHDKASVALHEWFVDQCKCINNELEGNVAEADEDEGVDLEPEVEVAPEMPAVEGEEGSEVSELMARVEELESEVFGDEPGSEDESAEVADDASDEVAGEEEGSEESEEAETAEDDLDEGFDFSDLEESFNHYAGEVTMPKMTGGKEIGTGAKFTPQDKSIVNLEDNAPGNVKGTPVVIHSDTHSGYERETAPAVKPNKTTTGSNVKKSGNDGQSKVPTGGDKSALLNKKEGFGSENTESLVKPISTKK